ncbi:TetR/AcrR family transcriptional regulator [Asaia lannensis]|uniref:TetR/AcrR family transcriptional regulator n=1 Tax=Asaia lannensis NBRC 102526 TaxID=1307926 RepID=A0ABT1CKG6_9PROT|nr:TetR/AcrR family transcriptional regulator [Asaia lannensis]MCO6161086.1 TetR/AcrR family transcriptional regulator [Asaia lannensis NBRC 102526]GBQ94315.1 transcriptional regulator [Asaia lannensis NBRC 102526]
MRKHCGRPPVLCETERRERIFDAAEIVLQQYGYSGASMDRIAQCSNMSKKTLYHMFASKQEMVELLLRDRLLLSGMRDLELLGDTVEDRLVYGLEALSVAMMAEKRLSLIRVVIAEVSRNPEVSRFVREFFSSAAGPFPLRVWLERLVEDGSLVIGDVEEASDMLFGSALATSVLCELSHCRTKQYWEGQTEYLRKVVRMFLAGLERENGA